MSNINAKVNISNKLLWLATALLALFLTALYPALTTQAASALTVCAAGCDYTTIQAAVDAAAAGDAIDILEPVHTEAGIVIDKSLAIRGQGAHNTTVQGDVTPGTARDSVFVVNNAGGLVTFQDLTIRHGNGNQGGAIRALDSSLSVVNSVLSDNQAVKGGGAISATDATLRIVNSTITHNTAQGDHSYGGGVVALMAPVLEVANSTISHNSARMGAGGLFAYETGSVVINASTVNGNSAQMRHGGGGLFLFTVSDVSIANSTISSNLGAGWVGTNIGTASLVNSTVARNSAGGLVLALFTATHIGNNIVADNTLFDCLSDAPIASADMPNLDSDGACWGFNMHHGNADLGPLQDNGGPTFTHALGPNSDAIDTADDDLASAPPINSRDQRNEARPHRMGCDLGAFEAPNRPPLAGDDNFAGAEDAPLRIAAPGVLADDADPEDDLMTALLEANPAHGMLSLSADGAFEYMPAPDFCGRDSFSYRASDGFDKSNVAVVSIDVQCLNDAPVAVDDRATSQRKPVIVEVLVNDFDPDGDSLAIVDVSAPAHGVARVQGRRILYIPERDFQGIDTFTYTISDGLETATATVTVNVS